MGRSQGSYCELFRASFFWNQLRENAELATSRPWQSILHSSVFLSLLCTDPSHIPARLILLRCHINHVTPAGRSSSLLVTQSVKFKTTARCCRPSPAGLTFSYLIFTFRYLQAGPLPSDKQLCLTFQIIRELSQHEAFVHTSPGCKFLCVSHATFPPAVITEHLQWVKNCVWNTLLPQSTQHLILCH